MKNKLSQDVMLDLYKQMLRIRLCEESLVDLILNGGIRCPVHMCTGQEAVPVGICKALDKKDYIFGNHRSHGHFLAKGGSMKSLVAEMFGKETGCSRGFGGSMHLIDPDIGMLGSAPIVAGTISLALGAALASSIRKDKRICVSFFGDGATGEGVLCESLNYAALKKLPIIFVCENNLYSTHLPINEIRTSDKIFNIAKPFGIKSYRIDGNNVIKVYEHALEAVDYCRSGNGPVFLECLTYRFHGHVGFDDNIQGTHTDIRPKEEINKWLKKDPILRFKRFLLKKSLVTVSILEDLHSTIMEDVKEAHRFSEASDYPSWEKISKYVFK
jgi:acetoin:2,6-dichlorophenolindophenol oxidoreductase subunit alpha